MSEPRRARADERPAFGSVWTWGRDLDHVRLMVLTVSGGSTYAEPAVTFLDLERGEIEPLWNWVTKQRDLDPNLCWYCIDEGPQ